MPFPILYSRRYELDLGGHIWPTSKYRGIVDRLAANEIVHRIEFIEPEPCTWEDLALVHTAEYLQKVRTGRLNDDDIATLELPWVPGLADGFRLMTGGTCRAAELALGGGTAVHLGGGLHHAFPNHGEGFCLFNDVAVAIRGLQREGRIQRAAIVDCDVHHGNGTAVAFERDDTVFTFSIHQQHNYPLFKPRSDLDIGLDDGTGDAEYLARLTEAMPIVLASSPQLIVYLAGADPFQQDRLGGLSLSLEGLRLRDRAVLTAARGQRIPVCIVLAGGYAVTVDDTVAIHTATVLEAMNGYARFGRTAPV